MEGFESPETAIPILLIQMTTSVANHPGAPDCAPVTYADWRSAVERELAGVPLEKKLVTRTVEGIDVQPLYRRVDAPAWTAVSVAGQPPYLRGTRLADGGAWRWAASGPVEIDCSPLPALAAAMARAQKGDALEGPAVAADPLGLLAARGSLPLALADCYSDMALGVREADQAGLPGRLIAVDTAAWHDKPTFYVISTKDRVIAPAAQKLFATRIKARTTEVAGSHASLVVHAKEVAAVIEEAALAE